MKGEILKQMMADATKKIYINDSVTYKANDICSTMNQLNSSTK